MFNKSLVLRNHAMEKPSVEMPAVAAFLIKEFGECAALGQLAEGEESRAFAFQANDNPYVLRISRSAGGFHKDAFAYCAFSGPALPIPEIVRIGNFDEDLSYCVSRKAAGITLQDLPEDDLPTIVEPVAHVLDVIASTDVRSLGGFGRFGPDGVGHFPTWHAYLMAIADARQYDWLALQSHELRAAAPPLLEKFVQWADHCPEICGLVHGDFGSNNVLAHAGRVTGVIDWSEALIGDPLYDMANIFFWRPWLRCMEHQALFLEQRAPVLERSLQLRAYQLRIGLEQLFQSAMNGAQEDALWALARCKAIAGRAVSDG